MHRSVSSLSAVIALGALALLAPACEVDSTSAGPGDSSDTTGDAGAPVLDCPVPTAGPTKHSGDIEDGEVWTAAGSPHIVEYDVNVRDGKTLTIEPCAEVRVAAEKRINVASPLTPNSGKLIAEGTPTKPIKFVGENGARWGSIYIVAPGTARFANVTFEDGGGDATFTATLNRTDGNVSLTGKTIDFYLNGTLVGSGVTGANGNPANVATFSGTIATPLAVGNYAGAVEAKFAGEADYAPSSATGAFKVKKRILWVQPKPQSRAANAANPGCASVADVQPFAPAPANTGLVNGDTLETAVAAPTGFFGCTYGVTNGTAAKPSKPGIYTIIASGLTSQNYDVRYKSGTLTVTP